MKKTLTFVLAAAVALFLGNAAYANYCARDIVPSATLLVPYIAVGMTPANTPDPDGATTYFGITNVSKAAQIVHVTVWDVLSTPQIDFDIVLSGYDVWEINWRDFLNGRFDIFANTHSDALKALPNDPFEFGPDGQDTNPVGGTGILTTPADRDTVSCSTSPYGDLTGYSSLIISKLSGAIGAKTHSGCTINSIAYPIREQYKNDWLSVLTKNPLFFYATADVARKCTTNFPNADTYFKDEIGWANVLVGDVAYVNGAGQKSEMWNAVHIEADIDAGTVFPGINAFYANVNDVREPLGTAFAFRYKTAVGDLALATRAVVWKKGEEITLTAVDDCLNYLYYAWDEDEHTKSRTQSSGCSGCITNDVDPNEFPFETQEVAISKQNFDVWDASIDANKQGGWFLLVFPGSQALGKDPTPDGYPTNWTQAWVASKTDYTITKLGVPVSFSGGLEAALLGNANCFAGDVLPALNTYEGSIINGVVKR